MKLVTAGIITHNNQVLLARRKKGQNLEGYWEFPGGKIEPNETPQACLERELFEELNLTTKAGRIIAESVYEYSHGAIKLLAIEAELLSDNIKLSVHDKLAWVTIYDVQNFKLAPADIEIARQLIRLNLRSQFQKRREGMAYWWVSQNKTHYEEREGGFLWAPKETKKGRTIFHWDTMKDVRQGDIIFSYFRQSIVAFSIAQGNAYDSNNPFKKSGECWEENGRRIDTKYTVLQKPISLPKIVDEFQVILQKQGVYKPLNKNGTGHLGYLFPLSDEAGNFLMSRCK
jgi:8-oxo-dGTP diphosphatase